MPITKTECKKMQKLVQEGKQISRIRSEDFPQYEYWEIYCEVYSTGGQSAQGIKKMITTKLNSLVDAHKPDRRVIVEELQGLVLSLYRNHKLNHTKLDKIRKALDA